MSRGPFGVPAKRPSLKKIFEAYGAQTQVWTAPKHLTHAYVRLCGGGGGGGSGQSAAGSSGGGGSGGGGGSSYAEEWLHVIPGATYIISIGAGGASDTDGGTTSMTLNGVTALALLGGKKGANGSTTTGGRGTGMGGTGGAGAAGGGGGTAGQTGESLMRGVGSFTAGDIFVGFPTSTFDVTAIPFSAGGGGSAGSFDNSGGGGGAASPFGGGGNGGDGATAGTSASGYGAGGGGGGGGGAPAGGSGTAGALLIYEIDSL